jgi:mersacidin/lichenicidin family type 2 lantibiotic
VAEQWTYNRKEVDMPKIDVIRAWKDEEYRSSLSADELGALPANPAGPMELSDDDLDVAAGGISEVVQCPTCCRCPDGATWSHSCCNYTEG